MATVRVDCLILRGGWLFTFPVETDDSGNVTNKCTCKCMQEGELPSQGRSCDVTASGRPRSANWSELVHCYTTESRGHCSLTTPICVRPENSSAMGVSFGNGPGTEIMRDENKTVVTLLMSYDVIFHSPPLASPSHTCVCVCVRGEGRNQAYLLTPVINFA